MKLKIKGKSLIISENKDNIYELISITNYEKEQIKKMIYFANDGLVYKHIEEELGLTINQVIAFGDGNPSHHTISKIILPINRHENRNVYPCFCNQETDPIARHNQRMTPILHEDCGSSFICARERLFYPDYCLILKISKDGKKDKEIITIDTEEKNISS